MVNCCEPQIAAVRMFVMKTHSLDLLLAEQTPKISTSLEYSLEQQVTRQICDLGVLLIQDWRFTSHVCVPMSEPIVISDSDEEERKARRRAAQAATINLDEPGLLGFDAFKYF